MKTALLATLAALVLSAPALADKPIQQSPEKRPPAVLGSGSATVKTFGTGEVKKKGDGSWTITNDPGEYGGIYYSASPHTRKLSKLHYSFVSLADGDVTGGAPRWSIPIDTDGDLATDGYAFLDVLNCGGTAGVKTTVSTDNSNCKVFFGPDTYANWKAFYTANPTYRLPKDGSVPFIIADEPGFYHIKKPVFG